MVREAGGTARARDLSYFSRRAEHTAFRRLALASTATDLQAASAAERPRGEACGVVLQARGRSERGVVTQGGAEVRLTRSYATCPRCGDGSFPPGR